MTQDILTSKEEKESAKRQAQSLISLIVFFLLLPLMILSFYFSHLSKNEVEKFVKTPRLMQVSPLNGEFYRLQGKATLQPLQKVDIGDLDIPKRAVSYRVIEQVRQNGRWVKSCQKPETCVGSKIKDFQVMSSPQSQEVTVAMTAAVTVVIGPGSQFHLPIEEKFKKMGEKRRLWIRYKLLPESVEVWGAYQHGYLADGLLDRLFVYPVDQIEEFKKSLQIKSERKADWLFWIGAVFLSIMSACLLIFKFRK